MLLLLNSLDAWISRVWRRKFSNSDCCLDCVSAFCEENVTGSGSVMEAMKGGEIGNQNGHCGCSQVNEIASDRGDRGGENHGNEGDDGRGHHHVNLPSNKTGNHSLHAPVHGDGGGHASDYQKNWTAYARRQADEWVHELVHGNDCALRTDHDHACEFVESVK